MKIKVLCIFLILQPLVIFSDIGKIRFHNSSNSYYLDIDYRLSGKEAWRHVFLKPGQKSLEYKTAKHGLGSADVRDMVISIFREKDYKPVDIALWSSNIDIKNNKTSEVYFKMFKNNSIEIDKRLDKEYFLGRKIEVDGKVEEKYLEKFGSDTKLRHLKILLHSLFNSSFKRIKNNVELERWIKPDKRLRLDEICLLASHNSFSSYQNGYKFYYQQYYDIQKQFDIGVRCFLLDCYPTKPGKNIDIKKNKRPVEAKLCHGKCQLGPVLRMKDELNYINLAKSLWNIKKQKDTDYVTMTLEDSLKILKNILDKNSDEVIFIELENYIDRETTDKSIKASGIDKITLTPKDWDIFENQGKWPTIDWMLTNNKQVVFWANNGPSDYVYNQWEIQRSNMYGSISESTGLLEERKEPVKKYNKNIEELENKVLELTSLNDSSKDTLENIAKLRLELDNLKRFKFLSGINLFPGNLLEEASKYISKASKKIEFKDFTEWHIRAGLSEVIKAVRNIKLYWGINYSLLNNKFLKKYTKDIILNGLKETGSLKNQIPNFFNLDQVHRGNAMKLVNDINVFSAKRLDNPNLRLADVF